MEVEDHEEEQDKIVVSTSEPFFQGLVSSYSAPGEIRYVTEAHNL
jgi:hypothetical protein